MAAELGLALVPLIAILLVLGIAGMLMLWRKGKTAEAISIVNTVMIVVVIILLVFPPP